VLSDEGEFDGEMMEFDHPPTPPLACVNITLEAPEKMNIEEENWDEGTDSKWKTYQNIRQHKKRFYKEQREIQK